MFLQDELYPPVETVLEMEPEELAPLVPLAGSGLVRVSARFSFR